MSAETMAVKPFAVRRGEGRMLDVFGVRIEVLVHAADTKGELSTYYIECNKGEGAPDHVHFRINEAFYVLDGEFDVRTGDKIVRAAAGAQVVIPKDTPHNFKCVSETGSMLGMSFPGGHDVFFEAADELLRSGRFNQETGAELCRAHDTEILPPLS
jgi:mannose-6-phosphate isomerase-like protein (cupin superfamily)